MTTKLSLILTLLLTQCYAQTTIVDKLYCPSNNKEAMQFFELGNIALAKGELAEAKLYFSKAIYKDTMFCDAWDHIGLIYKRVKDGKEEAMKYFFKSLKMNPNNLAAIINISHLFLQSNELKRAYNGFNSAIEIDSLNPEGYYGLACVLVGSKNFTEANYYLEKAKKIYNDKNYKLGNEVTYLSGIIDCGTNQYDKSIVSLESVYELYKDQQSINYYLGLAYILKEQPDKDKARKYLKKAKKKGAIISDEINAKLE
jgi:tetratricopeptide (TPR) repeat protein